MKTVLVEVTQDDIQIARNEEQARPWFPRATHCPVARAAQRALNCYFGAATCKSGHALVSSVHPSIPLPRSATRFIRRFDRNLAVTPFRFRVVVADDNA